jgi:hypothetical protein
MCKINRRNIFIWYRLTKDKLSWKKHSITKGWPYSSRIRTAMHKLVRKQRNVPIWDIQRKNGHLSVVKKLSWLSIRFKTYCTLSS